MADTAELPSSSCLRLQATYESSLSEMDVEHKKHTGAVKDVEERALHWISNFTAKFDEDFDRLTVLYKKIYQFLLLRCTSPMGSATAPKDPAIEREVAAALESVFPRVGLRSFVALTGHEKVAQLQELASIVLGIRVFNQHQKKGGAGLPSAESLVDYRQSFELLDFVSKEADEVGELCKAFSDAVVAARRNPDSPKMQGAGDAEVDRMRNDLLYHRQYLCYLLNLQEDLSVSIEKLVKEAKALGEELIDLDALTGGRVSIPKEQVYPRFDSVARGYKAAWQEVKALEARGKLHGVLRRQREQHFPALPAFAQALLEAVPNGGSGSLLEEMDQEEEPVDLDAIPGPGQDGYDGAVRLTLENSDNYLELPLDFQGFCIHSLVAFGGLLVPGNPGLGVVKYAGRFCVFATARALADFCAEPDRFFVGVREACEARPELIHLLRVHEDFPNSSLMALAELAGVSQAPNHVDMGTETPLHFQEANIDKTYEWNEWKLRQEALHMCDIRRRATSATQTVLSHLRRENETQVYLPKEEGTATVVNQGTNPPRWRKYMVNLRGEPKQMKVVELKFDL